eukprot:m.55709 g.55709  ORF g.55709 m.55709 type:complete len:749 (+) comp48907_c0_seq1:180-2426(+)
MADELQSQPSVELTGLPRVSETWVDMMQGIPDMQTVDYVLVARTPQHPAAEMQSPSLSTADLRHHARRHDDQSEQVEEVPHSEREELQMKLRHVYEARMRAEGLLVTVVPSALDANVEFVCIRVPFKRLCAEAEKTALFMPLATLHQDPFPETLYERLTRPLVTDQVDDYLAMAFEQQHAKYFLGIDNEETFFRTSYRRLLAYEILATMNIAPESSEDITFPAVALEFLLAEQVYIDAFAVPDSVLPDQSDALSQLKKTWGSMIKFQPLWRIRDYFGERIALYYAWLGLMNFSMLPLLLWGFIVFIYGVSTSKEDSDVFDVRMSATFDTDLTPAYAIIACIWSTMFLEAWKRKQVSLASQWDVCDFEEEERNRPQFLGTELRKDPVRGTMQKHFPFTKRVKRYFFSYSSLVLMICLVVISVVSVITFRVAGAVVFKDVKNAAFFFSIVPSILNAVSMKVLSYFYTKLAYRMTDYENHKTQTEYNDHLIIKLFAFQFVNAFAALYYIAFFRTGFDLWGNEDWQDACGETGNCMSLLSMQVFISLVIAAVPKLVMAEIMPRVKIFLRKRKARVQNIPNWIDLEFLKPSNATDSEDITIPEYTEKMIQYGYLVVFAAAFPLGPVAAILFNYLDMFIDSRNFVRTARRPIAHRAEDIGTWLSILEFVNMIAVITNGLLITFTSKVGRDFDDSHGSNARLWLFIGFEHIVFGLKFLLAYAIPDTPKRVLQTEAARDYKVQRMLEAGATKESDV